MRYMLLAERLFNISKKCSSSGGVWTPLNTQFHSTKYGRWRRIIKQCSCEIMKDYELPFKNENCLSNLTTKERYRASNKWWTNEKRKLNLQSATVRKVKKFNGPLVDLTFPSAAWRVRVSENLGWYTYDEMNRPTMVAGDPGTDLRCPSIEALTRKCSNATPFFDTHRMTIDKQTASRLR